MPSLFLRFSFARLIGKRRFSFWIKLALVTGSIAGAVIAVIIWIGAGQLLSPSRRQLQSYHYDWLRNPEKHGMRIKKFCAMKGQTPCLVVEPDGNAGPSQRGITLLQQLKQTGNESVPFGSIKGTLVLIHGRTGRKEDMLPIAERFTAVGFRCVIPDLPAHGESPRKVIRFGTDSFEASLAESVLNDAAKEFQFSPVPCGLWGISMGGAFATRAASISRQWSALVVVDSFDCLNEVVDRQVRPWCGPLSSLFCAALNKTIQWRGGTPTYYARPVDWASHVTTPVMIVHGNADRLIPIERGRILYASFAAKDKKWVEVNGGDHEKVLVTPMPLYADMAIWFMQRM